MTERSFDEMIAYFNRRVADMDINQDDKMELLGMVTALGVKHEKFAQPEIIRCAECKWYGRADKRRFYRGMDCLQNRIDTIIPDKDFCSRAERREG